MVERMLDSAKAKGVLVVLLAAVVGSSTAVTNGWTPETFPNPNVDPAACGRQNVARSSICDPDLMLSAEERDVLEGLVNEIHDGKSPFKKGPCAGGYDGYQVAVAIMRKASTSLPGDDKEEKFGNFARRLHDKWGVGNPACQNGVLFLISFDDRYMFISTGAGAKKRLTDIRVRQVVDSAKVYLKRNERDEAVETALQVMGNFLSKDVTAVDRFFSFLGKLFEGAVLLLFFVPTVAFCFTGIRKNLFQKRRENDVREKLRKMQEERDKSQHMPTYEAPSCPICMEDFITELPSNGTTSPDDEKRTLTCGHSYHAKCIENWLKTAPQQNCPICNRNAFDGSSSTGSDEPRQSTPAQGTQTRNGYATRYRLRRMHDLYPDIVTLQLMDTWLQNPNQNYVEDFDRHLAAVNAQRIQARASRRSSGAGGSSYSFGGGSSSGGGGGGGGW